MKRVLLRPSIHIEHPRGAPSRAYLWGTLDGKREDMVQADLTVDELLVLAEKALAVARILMAKT